MMIPRFTSRLRHRNPGTRVPGLPGSQGVSLIELVMAMVVIAIAIGALLSVMGDVLNSTVLPEIIDVSTHLAEQEMERVAFRRFSAVANEGPVNFPGSFSGYSYQISVTPVPVALANDPGMTQYKQVQVTVSHPSASSVSLRTIVTRN